MRRRLVLSFILILITTVSLFANDKIIIRLIDHFYLEQGREFIGSPQDIAVDEAGNIFVTDPKFHNIKMYDKKGRLIKSIGRRGGGPGEFESPWTIYYHNGQLFIQDVGLKKYIILAKDLNNIFKEIKRFFYLVDGYKFIAQDNRIVSNDYYIDKDGQDFRGIILDFSGKVIKPLIPIPYSKNDGWNRITFSKSYVDVSKRGEIYLAKAREVKLFKFSGSGELIKEFGQNPPYFRACKLTKDFEKAVFTLDQDRINAWQKWYSSFSWVSGLFILDSFLGIVIRTYDESLKKWQAQLQFYDLDGNLIQDGLELNETGTSSNEGFYLTSNHKDKIYILEMMGEEETLYKFYEYCIKRE